MGLTVKARRGDYVSGLLRRCWADDDPQPELGQGLSLLRRNALKKVTPKLCGRAPMIFEALCAEQSGEAWWGPIKLVSSPEAHTRPDNLKERQIPPGLNIPR